MKKLLFVLLTAALALPMMAQVKGEVSNDCRTATTPTFNFKHSRVMFAAPNRDEVPAGYASVTLTAGDLWQDGSGYQMLLDADATAYGTVFPETGALTQSGDAAASVYAEFEYKIPENADGSCSTSNIVMNNAVTILIPAGVYDWCITNPTPGDRIWISSAQGNIGGRADDYEFADGGIYTFTVYISGTNDAVDVDIYDPTAPIKPENVTADQNGNIAWENDHDPFFNLRYRPYDPNVAQTLFWGFEDDADLEGWIVSDADGDGYGWYIDDSGEYAHSGNTSIFSFSYWSGIGATTSDNWMISPDIELGGTLTFWVRNRSDYFPDKIAVYVAPAGGEFVQISEDIEPGLEWQEITLEIPMEFRGTGNFAFRHYDCTDQWAIFIDDISYEVPGNAPAEWVVVEGIEGNDYVIEGLDEGVTYEVQVQAVGVDGRTTGWTASTLFTYEPEVGPVDPEEKTDAPSSTKENYVYNDGNIYYNAYTVTLIESEPSDIYYRIGIMGEDGQYEYGDWMLYTGPFNVEEEGTYMIEAYAIAQGKTESDHIYDGFVVSKAVSVEELMAGKTVSSVRYFNVAGQEMAQPSGMTIMVTTYTDGTTSAVKVVK